MVLAELNAMSKATLTSRTLKQVKETVILFLILATYFLIDYLINPNLWK